MHAALLACGLSVVFFCVFDCLLFFFFWGGGLLVSCILDLSIQFLFFAFFLFLGDGLILDGYSKRTVKSKTTYLSNLPFRDIDSKITKSGRIF